MKKAIFIELLKKEVYNYLEGKELNKEAWNETLRIFEQSYPKMEP